MLLLVLIPMATQSLLVLKQIMKQRLQDADPAHGILLVSAQTKLNDGCSEGKPAWSYEHVARPTAEACEPYKDIYGSVSSSLPDLDNIAVRCRACYGVLRFIMESGAKGCEVIVSGKLRAQRAKAMKFKDGYMIASGQPVNDFIDSAVRHVLLRQGVLGIKVMSP